MLGRFHQGVASLIAVTLLAAAPMAIGDEVRFYTVGQFTTGSSGGTISNSTGSTSLTIDGFTLTFNFLGDASNPFVEELLPTEDGHPSVSTSFGNFTVSDTQPTGAWEGFSGTGFRLTVYQVDPGPLPGGANYGSVVGSIGGTLVARTSSTGSTLQLEFDSPTSFLIPPEGVVFPQVLRYDIDPMTSVVGSAHRDYPSSIEGQITAMPLPATASLGLALFGGLGAFNFYARRRPLAA